MRVTLLLADAAQTSDSKLYILGGGWSVTGPGPSTMAIAIKFEVPWNEANRLHQWKLLLVDTQGKPVQLPVAQDAVASVEITGEFETGHLPGLIPGTPLDVPLAITIGPLQLPPGQRYEWRLSVDDQTHDEWRLGFQTRPALVEQPSD